MRRSAIAGLLRGSTAGGTRPHTSGRHARRVAVAATMAVPMLAPPALVAVPATAGHGAAHVSGTVTIVRLTTEQRSSSSLDQTEVATYRVDGPATVLDSGRFELPAALEYTVDAYRSESTTSAGLTCTSEWFYAYGPTTWTGPDLSGQVSNPRVLIDLDDTFNPGRARLEARYGNVGPIPGTLFDRRITPSDPFDGTYHCKEFVYDVSHEQFAVPSRTLEGLDPATSNASATVFRLTGSVAQTPLPGVTYVTSYDLTISLAPDATETTYTGPTTMTYSDPVSLSGTLKDISGTAAVGIPGKQLEFTLGAMPSVVGAPTGTDGSASAPPTPVTLAPGAATVRTAFAGDASLAASFDTDEVQIERESCTLSYTGDTLVQPLVQTRLAAQLGETDAFPGDWAGKLVTFEVVDAALNSRTYTATTNQAGTAAVAVPLNADVYAVTASFSGDAFYDPCAATAETLVTVGAAGSKVTGGGWFSNTTGRTNFGFNAIPQTDGTFKGQLQVRPTTTKDTFHGTTVNGLRSLSQTSVQWTGTGQWNRLPGYGFTVTVVDNGSSGSRKGDTIELSIYPTSSPSAPVFTSKGQQLLRGGNLVVHH